MQKLAPGNSHELAVDSLNLVRALQNLGCPELLIRIRNSYSQGEFRRCVLYLAYLLDKTFSTRAAVVGALIALRYSPPLSSCIRLNKTEFGLQVELTRSKINETDCDFLLNYLFFLQSTVQGRMNQFSEDIGGLKLHAGQSHPREATCGAERMTELKSDNRDKIPQVTLAEALAVSMRCWQGRVASGHLGLSIKKNLIRALGLIEFFLLKHVPLVRVISTRDVVAIGIVLQEPDKTVLRLLRDHTFYARYSFAKQRRRLVANRRCHHDKNEEFLWRTKSDYKQLVSSENSSRIVTTIHMGDVLGAFNEISRQAPAGRRAISLRRNKGRVDNTPLELAATINHRNIRHGSKGQLDMVCGLRQGSTSLVILFDLNADFGETVEVEFFGRKAHFVKGPAQLAILGRAQILPFVTYEDGGRDVIEMEALIHPNVMPGETLSDAVTRITQILVSHAERWIKHRPAQWRYLDSIFSFIDKGSVWAHR